MEDRESARSSRDRARAYSIHSLTSLEDLELLCPVRYVYDYLPHSSEWLKSQPLSLNRVFPKPVDDGPRLTDRSAKGGNSICLSPLAANLPLHTGLEVYRQNRHWRANEKATRELLTIFSGDRHCSNVLLSNKGSMSSLAEEQLHTQVMDTYCRFSIYMFPEADQSRIQLLAQTVVLIFMFDGKQTPDHTESCDIECPTDMAVDVWEGSSPETVTCSVQEILTRTELSLTTDWQLARRFRALFTRAKARSRNANASEAKDG